ncbi:hypothetical protein [Xylella fastidiosa]|nr:hypothetical protein [Xylella fastidiosa]
MQRGVAAFFLYRVLAMRPVVSPRELLGIGDGGCLERWELYCGWL